MTFDEQTLTDPIPYLKTT